MWGTTALPLSAALCLVVGAVRADSLADVDHVVLFMQENRAFDHYFGTMAGVRGFDDANLQANKGVPVWWQKTTAQQTNETDAILPWHLNYLGGNWTEASQCMLAGSNGWFENHAAWNGGLNDHWAMNNTPWSIGYYKREDVPTQWALAEHWLVADMYQESVIAATMPNRITWASGSINVPGSPQRPDQGGYPYIDNNVLPGCDADGINCYPLKWKTAAEYYLEAGISWQVFQDEDNFDDNPLAWFKQFQDLAKGSELWHRAVEGQSLDSFYARAANGTLPELSYIVGPSQLSEHAPYSPRDGAWLQRRIAEAVMRSPKYKRTLLIYSFDETGGWFDHVDPYRPPKDAAGEWLEDPYGRLGYTFSGPGFRVPMYIISPWTRRGGVFTEHADHNSQLLFVEKWQAAKGRNVTTSQMVSWRREHMSDLVNAFDFERPDYSLPELPPEPEPHRNREGDLDGAAHCLEQYPSPQPPVPWKGDGSGHQMGRRVEHGFKPVRGNLTEGRYLVLETGPYALANPSLCRAGHRASLTAATRRHELAAQRWVVHAVRIGGNLFRMRSQPDGQFICREAVLCRDQGRALVFAVDFTPSRGHSFRLEGSSHYMKADQDGKLSLRGGPSYWSLYSVNY